MNGRAIFLAAALLLAAGAVSPAQESGGAGKELHLMHIQTAEVTRKAVAKAVERFEAATGARVVNEAVKNNQFKQKIAVVLPSNSPPDVFHTWGGGVLAGFVKKGLVEPLPEGFPLKGLSPQALEFCRAHGKVYAAPADISIVGFWYRKSLFAKHGIEPPRSFGELLEACVRLKQAGVTPIALGNVEHWPGAFYFDYLVLRLGGAPDYIKASNGVGRPAKIPPALVAGSLVRAFVDLDVFTEGFSGINYGQARAVLFKGDAAMTLMGSWLLSYAISSQPDVVPDLGLFPFPPLGPAPDSKSLLGGVNAAYAVSAKSAHKALAAKLVEFLTDETAARDWAKTGRIPARKVEMPGAASVLRDALKLVEDAPRIQLYFDQALEPAVAERHKPHTQSLFASEAPRGWLRLLVGAVAVVALVIIALALRTLFRSGDREAV